MFGFCIVRCENSLFIAGYNIKHTLYVWYFILAYIEKILVSINVSVFVISSKIYYLAIFLSVNHNTSKVWCGWSIKMLIDFYDITADNLDGILWPAMFTLQAHIANWLFIDSLSRTDKYIFICTSNVCFRLLLIASVQRINRYSFTEFCHNCSWWLMEPFCWLITENGSCQQIFTWIDEWIWKWNIDTRWEI